MQDPWILEEEFSVTSRTQTEPLSFKPTLSAITFQAKRWDPTRFTHRPTLPGVAEETPQRSRPDLMIGTRN